MKLIVKYFSKSTFATAQLIKANSNSSESIDRLKKVGKTRFGTHWIAATSLQPNLANIRMLTEKKEIKFKVCSLRIGRGRGR